MTDDDGDGDESGGASDEVRERMERAVREIRREGAKAAIIHAIIDGVALFLVVNFLLVLLDPSWLPSQVTVTVPRADPIPGWVPRRGTIPGSIPIAAGVGLVGFVVEVWLYSRRSTVERFEAGNPGVAERLRTARDAIEHGENTRMAYRLYADVLDRLKKSSSAALVDLRRIGVTVILVLLLGAATTQVVILDITVTGQATPGENLTTENESVDYEGLRDGTAVLGDSEDVSIGDENLTARIESTGGDRPTNTSEQFPTTGATGAAGGSGNSEIAGQQAGFASPEEIEDAELVREYNTRIREQEEE